MTDPQKSAEERASYDWAGRAITRHRSEIRAAYGFRESSEDDQALLAEWLRTMREGAHVKRSLANLAVTALDRLETLVRIASSAFSAGPTPSTAS
ncbi:DUF4158 domain-containing protein [Streptomyces virginiae]|nr:DUF4158 domain-containing protein [Streptomyces virginiae]